MMKSIHTFLLTVLSLFLFDALAPEAQAQKLSKEYFDMSEYGFKFKPLRDFNPIPVQERNKDGGVIAKMEGKELQVPIKGQGVYPMNAEIQVYRFVPRKIGSISTSDGDEEDIVIDESTLAEYVGMYYRGVNEEKVLLDKKEKINKNLTARHRQWQGSVHDGTTGFFKIDAWTFEVHDTLVHVVYSVPEKYERKWLKVFKKSARSFEVVPLAKAEVAHAGMSYDELLEFHDKNERDVGGWRAIATPSERYIIKTDSDDDDFIDLVIARLEKSRDLFETDFPPLKPIEHVSIVRICAKEETFHSYGETSGGVAGWFSPASTELVLYDGKNTNRNMTFAVMTHEGFHQYCHFLFDESEAHRWFDEGHGDYYGGAKMGRSPQAPMKITPKMPAGLGRLDIIRQMMREKTYKPIEEHINYSHREWQSQGPSNVSCYAQSWSLIYFLRQGTLGKVPSKVWKKEYANIIPAYISTLSEEYRAAYQKARDEEYKRKREKALGKGGKKKGKDEEGKEGEGGEKEEGKPDKGAKGDDVSISISLEKPRLGQKVKKEIWDKSMDASWGSIDMEEFERHWVEYVTKHLK